MSRSAASETEEKTRIFTVGIVKKEYQIFDNIVAETKEHAISIAFGRLKSGAWLDCEDDPEVCECSERVLEK